jgi:hypothetical protein
MTSPGPASINPLNLKPCPFCNGFAKTSIAPVPSAGLEQAMDEVQVYCVKCLGKQSDIDFAGADLEERARDVIKRWNRRANPKGFKP